MNAHVALRPSPEYLAAFVALMSRIDRSLGNGRPKKPVVACVAGGAAVHFYTGHRVSADIDASLSARVLLPQDLRISYRDAEGTARLLYFDTQYNDTLALMHPDAADDALPLRLKGIDPRRLEVRLLSPVDLAVSKLSRFGDVDREDIVALARLGLVNCEALRRRAEEALPDCVGAVDPVRTSIDLACRAIESALKPPAAAPRKGKRRSPPKR